MLMKTLVNKVKIPFFGLIILLTSAIFLPVSADHDAAHGAAEQQANLISSNPLTPAEVIDNGDGTYTVVCTNGTITLDFGPPPGTPPSDTSNPPPDIDICALDPSLCAPPPPPPSNPPPGTDPPGPICNSACVRDSDCQGAGGANNVCPVCLNNRCQPAATPTPVPACNVACQRDDQCAGARDGCTDCIGGVCKPPPACNSACVRDSDCIGAVGAQGVCPVCLNGTCQAQPTPTPVPACNVACQRDDQCAGARDGCTDCGPNNTCQVPPTPTPTPTPFNAAACKCDGVEYTDLFSGQSVTITSFGKVEGADTSKAIIKDQSFFLAEGAETIARIIGRSGPISSVVVSSTPEKVRFQSKWTFTLPQLKPEATYRIWSQINCQPRLQALNFTPARRAVLQAQTEQPRSFIDRMIEFLNNLFGGGKTATTTSVPTPTSEPGTGTGIILEEPTPTGKKSLQLGTIYPVEVYDKTCSFIKFRSLQASQ